ncbi:MAG: ImmA/IrrE family metallo-endopeptidase [Anaerolineae bacterium]|nr:ImmA/IrrE family metallo-endopeptidase [Anaerolineae bacterium]
MSEAAQLLGQRIRVGRERFGFTQKELADRMGFASHQIVSQIEKGERELKAWELAQLSRVLHISVVDLLSGTVAEPEPVVLWRKQPQTNKSEKEAIFLQRCRRYHFVEQVVGTNARLSLPSIKKDSLSLTFSDVDRLAQDLRRMLDLGARPAISLIPAAEEYLGIQVWYEDLEEDGSGASARGSFGCAVLLNSAEAPWRRNYSFAHELFHLITWNAISPESLEKDRRVFERAEHIAEQFASVLLLPADELLVELDSQIKAGQIYYDGLVTLAREFDVSTGALLWRCVNLNRLSAEAVKRILADADFQKIDRATMHAHWWNPPPLPERYVFMAFMAYQQAKLSRSKLAEYLEVPITKLTDFLLQYGLDDREDYQIKIPWQSELGATTTVEA